MQKRLSENKTLTRIDKKQNIKLTETSIAEWQFWRRETHYLVDRPFSCEIWEWRLTKSPTTPRKKWNDMLRIIVVEVPGKQGNIVISNEPKELLDHGSAIVRKWHIIFHDLLNFRIMHRLFKIQTIAREY